MAAEASPSVLDEAEIFVRDFLRTDSDKDSVFFHRPIGPRQPGQMLWADCALDGVVRTIRQEGRAEHDRARPGVIKVPVVAELLFLHAGNGGGKSSDASPSSLDSCYFEYQLFDTKVGKFVPAPGFRKATFNVYFRSWGEFKEQWRHPRLPERFPSDVVVAVNDDHRLVRYFVSVQKSGGQMVRTVPQVPRHWLAKDAIRKLEVIQHRRGELLKKGVSDREPSATGEDLARDLDRMRRQQEIERWELDVLLGGSQVAGR